MRRYSLLLLVVVLALAVGFGAVACGSGDKAKTPQETFSASIDAAKASTSQSGTYEIAVTFAGDPAELGPLGVPVKATGTFANQESPLRSDVSLAVGLMGLNVGLGAKVIEDKAWVNLFDQWYVIPAETLQQQGGAQLLSMPKTVQDLMDEKGIDVSSWCKDLKVVTDDAKADPLLTHLTGTVDAKKMATDVVTLMQSPKFAELMAATNGAAGGTVDIPVPTAAEIEQAKVQIEQMIKGATLDVWVTKTDSTLRKLSLNADVVIPAEAGMSGLSGANVVLTVNLDAPNKGVEVKAPESAKPLADLATDMQSNPLFGLLGGFMGSGGAGLLGQ